MENSRKGAKLVQSSGKPPVLMLSQLFKWFADDFKAASGSVLDFVLPFLPAADRESLTARKSEVLIRYFDYDWSLNRR